MNHKAVTMIEFVLAVAVVGASLVPITGSMLSYFKRVKTIEGSLGFTNRAQAVLNALLDDVSFEVVYTLMKEKGGGHCENVIDLQDRAFALITDLTDKKLVNRDGKQICPQDNSGQENTPEGLWRVSGNGTYFRSNKVDYYFTLKITNIPLQFHWKQYKTNENHNEVIGWEIKPAGVEPNVQTLDVNDIKRDMFVQLILYVKWKEYDRDMEYSFVTFKANLDNSNDK
ncbi:MAG: hypothetical protein PHW04_04575 [Candidatus Wallbacteria bacterium]|nr:hypothetical protein [Candidatus Wallbacteria bacterium]